MSIDLTPQELDYVMRCLMARPYGEVVGLVKKIMEQVNGRLDAPPSAGTGPAQ
jgi:hypothetical protein